MRSMDIKWEFRSTIKQNKWPSGMLRIDSMPPVLRAAFGVLAHSGAPKFWWPVLVPHWLFGGVFWKQAAITVVIGASPAGAMHWVIKHLVRRDRPTGFWGQRHATKTLIPSPPAMPRHSSCRRRRTGSGRC